MRWLLSLFLHLLSWERCTCLLMIHNPRPSSPAFGSHFANITWIKALSRESVCVEGCTGLSDQQYKCSSRHSHIMEEAPLIQKAGGLICSASRPHCIHRQRPHCSCRMLQIEEIHVSPRNPLLSQQEIQWYFTSSLTFPRSQDWTSKHHLPGDLSPGVEE